MKNIIIIIAFIISFNLHAEEIHCIPDNMDAPFDRIELTKIKRNKYSIVVKMNSEIMLTDKVAYTFLRRKQYGHFRNRKQDIVIKVKPLLIDQLKRSSMKVDSLHLDSFLGHCKLYSSVQ